MEDGFVCIDFLIFAMSHVDVCLMGNHDSVCCGKERPLEFISNRNYDIDLATRKLLTREQLSWLAIYSDASVHRRRQGEDGNVAR